MKIRIKGGEKEQNFQMFIYHSELRIKSPVGLDLIFLAISAYGTHSPGIVTHIPAMAAQKSFGSSPVEFTIGLQNRASRLQDLGHLAPTWPRTR